MDNLIWQGLSVFHQLILHPVKTAKEESFSGELQNHIEKKKMVSGFEGGALLRLLIVILLACWGYLKSPSHWKQKLTYLPF